MNMRILHTEWSDGLGGQEKRILSESLGLAERGHYVALVCREHARIKGEAGRLGIDVHTLPLRKPYDIESIMRLTSFIKSNRFDIVNTHSGVDSWIGGIAAKFANIPVLARTRHLNIPLKRSIINFIHYLPDVYITCGDNMRNNLVSNCRFPAEKVVSIPTGVGKEFFDVKKNSEEKRQNHCPRKSNVITIQNGESHKGADHGHFSLGKVENLRGFIDNDHGKSQKRIAGSHCQTAHNQLTEHIPPSKDFNWNGGRME